MAEVTGIPFRTLEAIEQRGQIPGGKILEKVAKTWPKYAYWLMTGDTIPEVGQVSPEMEAMREDSKKTVKGG